eukprot:643867-Hanusia_phi.AAC.1
MSHASSGPSSPQASPCWPGPSDPVTVRSNPGRPGRRRVRTASRISVTWQVKNTTEMNDLSASH